MKKFFILGVFAVNFSASAQRPADIFNYYRDSLQPERIYVHFDKDGYIAGDTIWFKAYFYSGFDISDYSTNFFIKIYDRNKKLVTDKKLPIFNGTAEGFFDLPVSLPQDIYFITAYTTYSLNFNSSFVYKKAIPIFNVNKKNNAKTSFHHQPISVISQSVTQKNCPDISDIYLSFSETPKGKRISISASDKVDSELLLIAIMQNNILGEQKLVLKNGKANAIIDTTNLPAGVLQVYLFNRLNQFITESDCLIGGLNSQIPVQCHVDPNSVDLSHSLIQFLFPDSLIGNFSISISDVSKEVFTDSSENILSNLLLSGNQKWSEIKNKPVLKSKDSRYLCFAGKVFDEWNKKIVPNGNLNLIIQSADSSQTILTTPITSDGGFQVDNLIFEDTAQIFYELETKNNVHKKVNLHLRSQENLEEFVDITEIDSLIASKEFILENKNVTELIASEQKEILRGKGKTLPVVTVKTKKITATQEVNRRYTTGIFGNQASKTLDFINDPPDNPNVSNLFEYLRGKVPGLVINYHPYSRKYTIESKRSISMANAIFGEQDELTKDADSAFSRNGYVDGRIFLNELEVESPAVQYLPLNQIALIKFFQPGANSTFFGRGVSCILAIYTKQGEDLKPIARGYLNQVRFPGYAVSKEFTIGGQKAGATLYWNPHLILNGTNNKVNIKIPVSENIGKMRVVLEGITIDGKLVRLEKVVE